ncbi:hypothetical protein FPV67DRAFT_1467132 [Lyophyllum atratum]|nr:hypothetical protein FPV67DRAFT_1467132 [Lyophyllum atratum]
MAKPILTGCAGCSTPSPSRPSPENLDSHPRPRRRRRPPASAGPSPALLSLLATISASSTSVHGSPAPPSFLCPSLEAAYSSTRTIRSRGTTTSKIRRSPQLSTKGAGGTRHVPAKFVMDDNGVWRRVESYTLYGSTVCLTCQDATTSVASVDDQIQGPASSSIPKSTASSSPSYNIHDELPPGWKPPVATGGDRTTLILALSLVLAFFICFLIIGCLFWRKSRRRKRKQNDVEDMKGRRRRRGHSTDEARESMLALEKEVKVKQKIWAKATARWKANAKYTARQRRGKRIASTTRIGSPHSSRASLDRNDHSQPTPHISTSSPTPSPTLTRRSSLESLYTHVPAEEATASAPSSPQEVHSDCITSTPLSSGPPLPPAYHLRISVPEIRISSEDGVGDGQSASLPLSPHGSPYASSSNYRSSDPRDTSYDRDFHAQPIHAAHVATDDKALLARLADLASAPPDGVNPSQADSAVFHVCVPMWQDEELEDFRDGPGDLANCSLPPSRHSSRSSSPAPIFPPPPSKGKMAATSFYDYPYSFEDLSAELDPGPSAPPFEEEPSYPSDLPNLAPSAPPLSDAYYLESYASAPTHDAETFVPLVNGQSGDRIEQPQHQSTISTSDAIESTSSCVDSSIPLVQGPVASDGTPPSYHP